MSQTIDYFLVPNSPWTYLGHERFAALAARAGAEVRFKPMDLAQVFPVSGGLPLGQRAPQRQAYRLMELKRFSESLDMPLTIHPAFFPRGSRCGDKAAGCRAYAARCRRGHGVGRCFVARGLGGGKKHCRSGNVGGADQNTRFACRFVGHFCPRANGKAVPSQHR